MARMNVLEMIKEKNPYIKYQPDEDKDYMTLTEKQVMEILEKGCVFIDDIQVGDMIFFTVSEVELFNDGIKPARVCFGYHANATYSAYIEYSAS